MRQTGRQLWRLAKIAVVGALFFWGWREGRYLWKDSTFLQVKSVRYEGDIPEKLRSSLGFSKVKNLLALSTGSLEKSALQEFPELESLNIRRSPTREVVVTGVYRRPLATLREQGPGAAIDGQGVIFSIAGRETQYGALPLMGTALAEDRKVMADCLRRWKNQVPAFYSLVKEIETDKMHELRLRLDGDVSVRWGDAELGDILARANNVMKTLTNAQWKPGPASILFVTDERLVVEANWIKNK